MAIMIAIPGSWALSLLLGCSAGEPQAQGIAGLWLMDLHSEGATVRLRITEREAPEFRFGVRGGELKPHAIQQSGRVAVVRLTGLQPATHYEARCGWRHTTFMTPPKTQRKMTVSVVGHTGGTRGPRHHPWSEVAGRLDQVSPDFVIHAGDTTENCLEEYFHRDFFTVFDRVLSRVPIYVAPGNHEGIHPNHEADYSTFRRCFPYPFEAGDSSGPAYYEIQRGSARFLFLTYYPNQLGKGTAQRVWLDARLQERVCPFTILVLGMNQSTFAKDEFLKSLPKDKVDLVIAGDGAGSWIRTLHGIPVLFNGMGEGAAHPDSVLEIEPHHINLLTFRAGRILHTHLLRDRFRQSPKLDLMDGYAAAEPLKARVRGARGGPLTLIPTRIATRWVAPISPGVPLGAMKGLQLEVRGSQGREKPLTLYIRWDLVSNERGRITFRSQPVKVMPSQTWDLVTDPTPWVPRLPGEELKLVSLTLQFDQNGDKISSAELKSAFLF